MMFLRYYILLFLGCVAVVRGLPSDALQKDDTTVDLSDKAGNILVIKDLNKNKGVFDKMKTMFVQTYVDMYRHKNVNGVEEKDDDFFCAEDQEGTEDPGVSVIINQVGVPGKVFKYFEKYIVKKSYTPFSFIKNTLETFGVLSPIGNEIHKKDLSVLDPLTSLFANMQQLYNSYEDVEKEEIGTRLMNKLARTSDEEKNKKPGLITGSKCAFKKADALWDEIFPYDPYHIVYNLAAAGVWLFAFWGPLFPFLFSFPARNGFGGIAPGDANRRDQQPFDYYDTQVSQYSTYEGNSIGTYSVDQAQPYHVNYSTHDTHASPFSYVSNYKYQGTESHDEASPDYDYDIVKHHVGNSRKVEGTQNVFVSNDKNVDIQEVSSYTSYNENDLWYNHVSLK